jgi:hypothetical protein
MLAMVDSDGDVLLRATEETAGRFEDEGCAGTAGCLLVRARLRGRLRCQPARGGGGGPGAGAQDEALVELPDRAVPSGSLEAPMPVASPLALPHGREATDADRRA